MKLLKDILYKVRIVEVIGSTNAAIESITSDSRAVKPMGLFVAVSGTNSDGHNFIHQAIAQGASAIVCERIPEEISNQVVYIVVENTSVALAVLSCNFFDNPSHRLKIVAVTGTNGKTTTATLLFRLFRSMNYKCGLLSTVVNRINDIEVPSTHTTPNSVQLNELLARMVSEGCTHVFMEASSHALHQHRMTGLQLKGAVFTNLTHDHLDYHGSMNEYIKAKKMLFDMLPSTAFAIVNGDDRYHETMVAACKAKVKTYALHTVADYKTKVLENQLDGLKLSIMQNELHTLLIGEFNAYNLTAVFAIASELGIDSIQTLTHLSVLTAPEGRFQTIRRKDGAMAVVDYAHTPDALENVLDTIRSVRSGNELIITVVGCGGDRDKSKRPTMAVIASEKSDKVILTSDNPRSEDPKEIINEMLAGLDPIQRKKVLTITDRREALSVASQMAGSTDIILVSGKGHEKYQEIQGVRYAFDDLQIMNEFFQNY
jgi:UDP-N-acetylmuramoyl-L-alanyl-D-glutamate--2,6-diaminopimelate ligase